MSQPTPRPSGRWTPEYATTVLDDFEHSNLSLTDFAHKRGLDIQRLRWWRNQLGRADKPRIVELLVKDAPALTLATKHGVSLRIHCPSGHLIEMTPLDSESALVSVLRALQEATC